jgi:hypothetical protein
MSENSPRGAADLSLAFVAPPQPRPGLEIRVNFGLFAAREATPSEIDELARRLLYEVGDVTIVSEQRHELSADAEASIHQVRVAIDDEQLPDDADELEVVTDRLVAACDLWARRAIDARHIEV